MDELSTVHMEMHTFKPNFSSIHGTRHCDKVSNPFIYSHTAKWVSIVGIQGVPEGHSYNGMASKIQHYATEHCELCKFMLHNLKEITT